MKYFVVPIAILLILGLVGISQAKQLSLNAPRWSVGDGGVTTGGNYQLSSIANQPIAGSQSGGDFHLKWGFWRPPSQEGTIFLPMVVKPGQGPASSLNFIENGPGDR